MSFAGDQRINIVIIEDIAGEAELIRHELSRLDLPLDITTVSTKSMLIRYLENRQPAMVVADECHPELRPKSLLEVVNGRRPGTEVVVIGTQLHDDRAAEYSRIGITAYLTYADLFFLSVLTTKMYKFQSNGPQPARGDGRHMFGDSA